MIDESRFMDVIAQYKQDFENEWERERFKWEAAKHFQDNWDVNASDFADMLSRSTIHNKIGGPIDSAYYYPRTMIMKFAKTEPEKVRAMFIALYDESLDLYERIKNFKAQSVVMLEKYGEKGWKHFQTEHVISVYLWLRYPDWHYIYRWTEVTKTADMLKSPGYIFKRGAYKENIRQCIMLYDEIREVLKRDAELPSLCRRQLTDDCWPDRELMTRTQDIAVYISQYLLPNGERSGKWRNL